MFLSRLLVGVLSVNFLLLTAGVVSAQNYPNKTIRIVTDRAGGGSDFVARQIAQGIAGPLGQPVVVDNQLSVPGFEIGAKAPPDGYTLNVAGAGLWIFHLMNKDASFDTLRDFAPISQIVREVLVVVVHPSLPVKSISELIALAKAKPGGLNYASGGVGGTSHLATELFKSMAGVNIVHVPYNNLTNAIVALLSNESQIVFSDAGLVPQHVKAGKLRALAVTSATPSALVPGLPTVAASGLPGYEWLGMTGLLAPAKTPMAIINRLNQEVVRAVNVPEVKEAFLNNGQEVVANSPEQYTAVIKTEIAKVSKVIKEAGIKTN